MILQHVDGSEEEGQEERREGARSRVDRDGRMYSDMILSKEIYGAYDGYGLDTIGSIARRTGSYIDSQNWRVNKCIALLLHSPQPPSLVGKMNKTTEPVFMPAVTVALSQYG